MHTVRFRSRQQGRIEADARSNAFETRKPHKLLCTSIGTVATAFAVRLYQLSVGRALRHEVVNDLCPPFVDRLLGR